MKKILLQGLFVLTTSLFISFKADLVEPTEKHYYFGMSREVPYLKYVAEGQKLGLLFTPIHEAECGDDSIHQLAVKFSAFVKQQCKPGNEMCTSDLNHYSTLEQAQKRHKEILAKYEAMGTYSLKQVDFKFD